MRLPTILLACFLLIGCSPGDAPRDAFDAALLLKDLAAPAEDFGSERLPFAFAVEDREWEADRYVPSGGHWGHLILVPGVSPMGRDDPRLVAAARALARRGFALTVPEIPEMRMMAISAADADPIADTLTHVAGENRRKVGLVSFSYAVGPAVLAALRPNILERLGPFAAIGGYRDMISLIGFFTTGGYGLPPNSLGTWLFLRGNADRLQHWSDRAILKAIAERRLRHGEAPIGDLAERLGVEGRAVLALALNRDPDKFADLIANLPAAVAREIEGLDLARRDLSPLKPHAILIHGRNDRIVPAAEGEALARAIGTELYLVDALDHVDLRWETSWQAARDMFVLWRAAYRLMRFRQPPS